MAVGNWQHWMRMSRMRIPINIMRRSRMRRIPLPMNIIRKRRMGIPTGYR